MPQGLRTSVNGAQGEANTSCLTLFIGEQQSECTAEQKNTKMFGKNF
jgi:hypothetical protein